MYLSKRGNRYLRVLFVTGSMGRAGQDEASQVGKPRLKPWIEAAKKRLYRNVLAIALANKLERID